MTDEHCGKKMIKKSCEYKTFKSVQITKFVNKCPKKIFSIKIQRENHKKFARITDEYCGKSDVKD